MNSSIISIARLGTPWQTIDPFLVCAHHVDHYPPGNTNLGPCEPLPGGAAARKEWRMYLGQTVPGFPAHPHRGFETITIVRHGVVDHSDSLGASARYGAGDVQWLTAGRGIVHAEMFPLLDPVNPNTLELFQIWLNLPARDKMADPNFRMFWAEDIPGSVVTGASGRTEVTCIVGALPGVEMPVPPPPPPRSWAADPDSDVAIWTLKMESGAKWQLPAASGSGTRRQLFFFSGSRLSIAGESVAAGTAIEVNCSVPVELVNGSAEAEILLLQGRPLAEPVEQHGPFVMNSLDEIRHAYADYRSTRFGHWNWGATDPVHGPVRGRLMSP
jgi:redox-sensitive bicupin YhaK (pirin superfamily)